MRRALIPTVLLVLLSVVLGATVFREPLANAKSLAQSVIVGNTPDNPVPVHEQGTANVNVTGGSLSVVPVTGGGEYLRVRTGSGEGPGSSPAVATALAIHLTSSVSEFGLVYQGNNVAQFTGPALEGPSDINFAFTRPVKFDGFYCRGEGTDEGWCSGGWVGAQP